jgi:HEXXH motif-containing protein
MTMAPAEIVARDQKPHGISWDEFDLIASVDGSSAPVRKLRSAERSRRLLLLRSLIDEVVPEASRHEPLPSPGLAWDLLVRVEEADPAALDAVLLHPYTGSWLGLTTRALRRPAADPRPLWMHVGHIHAVAAAAALRARLTDFRVRVPAWQGDVVLPTLGVARFEGAPEFSVAEVRAEPGAVVVTCEGRTVAVPADPSDNGPGWLGVRTFDLAAGRHRLVIRLDDVDPYRGLFRPLRPQRLTDIDVGTWHKQLTEAWQLVVEHAPEFTEALPAGLESIVPEPEFPFRLPSASSGESFGSALICYPEDPAALAATLIHEFQHIRLGGLLQFIPLQAADRRERLYAPWRDDPRPLGGVIHGVYAFFGVAAFYRTFSEKNSGDRLAAFEFAHWRDQVWNTLESIRDDEALNDAGRRFLEQVAGRVEPWLDIPVHEDVKRWSKLLAADHRGGWRLRHLRPDTATVERLAGAWLRGLPCPVVDYPAPELVTKPDGDWTEARYDLLRVRLGPNGKSRAKDVWREVPNLREADFALLDDRPADALDKYRKDLCDDPDRPNSLIGLAMALRWSAPDPAADILFDRPELVRAVHRVVRRDASEAVSPEDVARWMAAPSS